MHRLLSSLGAFMVGLDLGSQLLVDRWPNFQCIVVQRVYNDLIDEVEVFGRNEADAINSTVESLLGWFRLSEKKTLFIINLPDYLLLKLQEVSTADDYEMITSPGCFGFLRRVPFENCRKD